VVKKGPKNNEQDIYALAVAVYGWMPTVPKTLNIGSITTETIDQIAGIDSESGMTNFLRDLEKPLINNSWVGTSKLLHFLNTEYFPIWDSRIARVVDNAGAVNESDNLKSNYMGKKTNYLNYVEEMLEFKGKQIKGLDKFRGDFEILFGYVPSEIRSLEMALFFKQPKE